ncbi:MAG: 3-hydroxybutyrate dehydrogenase [Tistlia sp.]|uniref:3-hydroxybutyrate dehydrogenase n=1 Tax=Tistlia sp. TaxID=3057121 RepID=UPI0034A37D4C
MTDLSGKTALVTGSTSGIGEAIARALAAQGADIVLNGFGEEAAIARLKTGLAEEHGVKVVYDGADMSRPAAIETMMKKAEAEFGAVDILVNNAGIQHTANLEDFPAERWDAVIAINLSSAFHTTHHALPAMKRRGWGRILNVASAHGLVASVQKSAYVAAKHGIVGLTKVTALETARDGITANAICPGWVLTPLVQKQIDALAERESLTAAAAREKLIGEKMPSGEPVTPEQIGAFAVFLCSPAAERITGAALPIDGGWTAQ